jgi:hypothetical protein
VISKADTSNFRINKKGNWVLYNSYVKQEPVDSVSLLLIVKQFRNIEWNKFQFVGTIKERSTIPSKKQDVLYYLLNDSWLVRIDTDGKCYIKLNSGSLPQGDPVILPIQIKYKKG